MASGDGRRVLRIQPNSNIKAHIKSRFRGTKQKLKTKPEPTTLEQLERSLEEFADFDGTVENSNKFIELIGLVTNASKDLLEDDDLFNPIFERTPILLCNDDHRIRTAFFRLLRLLLINEQRLMLYLDLLVDMFAVRSLDILILPKAERFEALRLVAKLLSTHLNSKSKLIYSATTSFPASSLKSIHAVAVHRLIFPEHGEPEPRPIDELNKAALTVLLEASVLDPVLVIDAVSTDWIPRVLVAPGINNFQICALVCRVLSAWLDDPEIREKTELQLVLEQIFAPLLDLGFFNQVDSKLKNLHKVTHTLECCANIFLNLMVTWPGFFACASTEPLLGSIASPLKFLSYLGQVKSVGSNLDKIREIVIDVCCDFVCMPYSGKNFATWSETLLFYSKLHQPDQYEASLRDNFVVGELQSALALGFDDTEYVDLLLSFRALATFVLINFGLVQSLIRLILTAPNEPMALKATLLLSDLLRTSISFVPRDWKQLLLSTPALVQLIAQSLLGTVAGQLEKRSSVELEQCLPSSENSILLLNRLEDLHTVSKTRPNMLSQLKHANLFVLPHKAGHDRPRGKFYEDDSDMDGRIADAISSFLDDNKYKWMHFEFLINTFRNLSSVFSRWQHNDKAHNFFVQVTEFFAPKNQTFLKESITPEIVKLGALAFRLMVRLAESEPYYNEALEKYVTDFCRELPENVLYNGVFCPRNIMHTNVFLYFGITAAIGSKSHGHAMFERLGFYQITERIGIAKISQKKITLKKHVKAGFSFAYNRPFVFAHRVWHDNSKMDTERLYCSDQ
ncbi:Rapamycin-insensitive companion of mTOR [Aphelenchoides bicaudatus]|nr:Rapamycin-insensitive companion of mTOR [Aphelenchoides bicaudatus]